MEERYIYDGIIVNSMPEHNTSSVSESEAPKIPIPPLEREFPGSPPRLSRSPL